MTLGRASGLLEGDAAGDGGGVDHDGLLEPESLADQTRVVDGRVGQAELVEPSPYEGVPPDEDDEGVEAGLLEHAGKENAQVEAGADPANDLLRRTDALSGLLEAGGWVGVADAGGLKRSVAGANDGLGVPWVFGLIARQAPRRPREALQVLGRVVEERLQRRVVGEDEGGQ